MTNLAGIFVRRGALQRSREIATPGDRGSHAGPWAQPCAHVIYPQPACLDFDLRKDAWTKPIKWRAIRGTFNLKCSAGTPGHCGDNLHARLRCGPSAVILLMRWCFCATLLTTGLSRLRLWESRRIPGSSFYAMIPVFKRSSPMRTGRLSPSEGVTLLAHFEGATISCHRRANFLG